MADGTRIKELSLELKRITEQMEKNNVEAHSNIKRLEVENGARFEKIKNAMQLQNNALTKILAAMELKQVDNSSSSLMMEGDSSTKLKSPMGSKQHSIVQSRAPFQVRPVKLDFPRFDGKNVISWIFKAQQFFEYYDTPDSERLLIASVNLDQEIVPWYQMMQRVNPFQSWNQFTRALELDFGPSPYECPRANLFKLQQNSTVSEYYLECTALANCSEGLSNEALLDCFISGLQEDIRRDVKSLTPNTMLKAVSLAKLFEEKNTNHTKNRNNTHTNKPYTNTNSTYQKPSNTIPKTDTSQSQSKLSLPPLLPTPGSRQTNTNLRNIAIKNISPTEIQLRRDKGLCYFCDEKWSYAHKCSNKQFMLLQCDEEEEDSNVTIEKEQGKPTGESEAGAHHLSLNAMNGGYGVGTIRFTGFIGQLPVQMLVDGGSSENFLQPRIAQCLKLPIESKPNFQVLIGNGDKMKIEGWIEDLKVQVQQHELLVLVYLLLWQEQT